MSTDDTNAARRGSESNDLLGQASEARWYCLDRDGVAMLCKDEADARAQVIESNDCWPARAPHRAVLLGDVAAERERCAKLCEELEARVWRTYKNGGAANQHTEGRSDGAGECAALIRGA